MGRWELRAVEHTVLKQLLDVLEKIKEIQVSLEASDSPNFMLVGRQVIHLLYTEQTLNRAVGVARLFVEAFKSKLAACVSNTDLVLEWGVAAILDPRQQTLGKFGKIWEAPGHILWLGAVRGRWREHKDFVKEVVDLVIHYATELVDESTRSTWPAHGDDVPSTVPQTTPPARAAVTSETQAGASYRYQT